MSKIKPLYSKLVVKPRMEEEITESGIFLTGKVNQKKQIADVIAVGSGYIMNDGNIRSLSVQQGDVIIYEKFAGTLVRYNSEQYLIIDERDVLAIIEN